MIEIKSCKSHKYLEHKPFTVNNIYLYLQSPVKQTLFTLNIPLSHALPVS